MTKALSFLATISVSTGALAHAGHIEQSAGHNHWALVGGALLLGAAIATPLALRLLRKTAS